ncbi:MAG: hypothetical protein ACXVRO_14055 [Gaiellaceae bacterium]
MHRVPIADERARPVVEHVCERDVISDTEGEVQVGEPVAAAVHGQRAHGGSGDDPLILLRELQHVLAESIALLNGEHDPRS